MPVLKDGTLDFICDYDDGIDRIDQPLLTGINGLDIYSRPYGAVIAAGDEEIHIEIIDGTALTLNDFISLDSIFEPVDKTRGFGGGGA